MDVPNTLKGARRRAQGARRSLNEGSITIVVIVIVRGHTTLCGVIEAVKVVVIINCDISDLAAEAIYG